MYHENDRKLDAILKKAEGRGDNEFYDQLVDQLEKLSNTWATQDEGGDLTREEITKLIARKDFIRNRIREIRGGDR